ncbi:MAG TPA: SigB/SigF/SigG family RNA polymerase sigma factor [Candidatus Stercoripulliclostridium merdipullorum]|uniref:RNA polymerase sigma factor n=1 Tax=Candidatus Stercoripulliclostridium merdipullorum TaxID=2840952 RepID=A0A9D1SXF9_9FIRM|nr:SigB/SigF/SigG family RNA polymerase sigma factor [Candidatus Stercoripulliclostridium merdipullorum]
MLDSELTLQLIVEAQAGSDRAKQELVEHNLPLIKSIVRRYRNKQIEYEDLMQLGTLGLVKAIKHFDTGYGVRFSTYAVPMIAGEIKRFIRDDGAIKVSRSIKSKTQQINRFIDEYRVKNGKEPTVEEVAEAFGLESGEVIFYMDSARYPLSIYAESEEDGLTLADKIAGKGTPDDAIDKMMLKEVLLSLEPRERKIIMLRYFRDKTQSEIARELGVSQVQVSRLEAKILKKMREQLEG